MKIKTQKDSIHTLTPWQVLEDGQLVGNVIETQHSLQVTRIADMERVNRRYPEDAAFIVRAVNSHEALLKAAHIAAVRLEGGTKEEQAFNAGVIGQLRKAISLAERGE